MHNLNWNDLRFVLAVAKEGSAAAAARALKVSHSTVVRRVSAFEERHQVRIFDHLSSGYRLTPTGASFLDTAQSIDALLQDLSRKLEGNEDQLAGRVRITSTDTIVAFMSDILADLRRTYPGVTLDVLVANQPLDLGALDADLAIRPTRDPPALLVGRRICTLGFAIYAPREALEKGNHDATALPWLGLAGPLATSSLGQWLGDDAMNAPVVVTANSFNTLRTLAELGAGKVVLPCFLGDASASLTRVKSERLAFHNDLWLLHHPDVLRSKRMQVVAKFLVEALRARRAELEG